MKRLHKYAFDIDLSSTVWPSVRKKSFHCESPTWNALERLGLKLSRIIACAIFSKRYL